MNNIVHISEAAKVSMGDDWFDIATVDHFWIRRRFDTFSILAGDLNLGAIKIAEVGCGHGLLQTQVGQHALCAVDGFDLNLKALSNSVATGHKLYHYDITERRPEFKDQYDLIFLFDVLEHVDDPAGFLSATSFMTRPGGRIAINVPALQALYSAYDEAAGHLCRYSKADLERIVSTAGLHLECISYWGLPLVPLLWLRKILLANAKSPKEILKTGFAPPSAFVNKMLSWLCRLEKLPQGLVGSSLMAIARK